MPRTLARKVISCRPRASPTSPTPSTKSTASPTPAATSSPTPSVTTSPSSASAPATRPQRLQQSSQTRFQTLELPRSFAAVGIEKDLAFDPLFGRHLTRVERALYRFRPDIIHITGPSELGLLGAWFAHELGIPLAASWHTNVHEYAARRLNWLTCQLSPHPGRPSKPASNPPTLWATAHLYRQRQGPLRPQPRALRPPRAHHPPPLPPHAARRRHQPLHPRPPHPPPIPTANLILGYVGRLSIEKNVALLPIIEQQLAALGIHNVHFLIIGHGGEEASLRAALPAAKADFAGVLRGEALATAYANMDLLVFPSHTDTFGNVVLEALASGVPAIVTPDGGPKYIVRHNDTGFIAPDEDFATAIATLANDRHLLNRMRKDARAYALTCSWDAVFDRVYRGYSDALATPVFAG